MQEQEMKDFWKMILASMLLNLVIAFIAPLLAIFVEGIGEKNILSVGYAFGASFITQAVVSSLFGKLADKYGRKRFLILGNVIYSFVPFGYLFASNIVQIILLQIIMGIGNGMSTPAFLSLLSGKMKKNQSGSGFGIWNSMNTLVIGMGALIGSSIVHFLGFKTLFIVMGIIQIGQTVLIAMVNEK